MRVRVKLFAAYREIVGAKELPRSVDDGGTLGDLLDGLFREYPRLAGHRGTMLLAVNQAFVDPGAALHDGDEVALLPPVSGGRA
jgi:molybdopterin converting factor subunit 1